MLKRLIKAVIVSVIFTAVCGGAQALAQNRTVKGTVVDVGGQPVIGAAVTVVGNTKIGTATDLDGAFTLSIPSGANLLVESIGYVSQTITVGN